jgi:hypothetical protein
VPAGLAGAAQIQSCGSGCAACRSCHVHHS